MSMWLGRDIETKAFSMKSKESQTWKAIWKTFHMFIRAKIQDDGEKYSKSRIKYFPWVSSLPF